MDAVQLIVVMVFLGIVALVIFGNIKGPPDPASMSIDAIVARIQSEGSWIEKYQLLPLENQQGAGIKKQFEGKKLYVMQLNLEFMKRQFEASGKKPEETMIPILQRTIELIKGGTSEADAHKQAAEEFVQKRDAARLAKSKKGTV